MRMTMLDMLDRLVKEELAGLLSPDNRHRWRSLHVTYHPPRVERLWIQLGDHRLFLHRVYPCGEGEALFHPHPWPSAVRVVSGLYEMGISSEYFPEEDDTQNCPAWTSQHATVVLGPRGGYEMTDRHGWHYVRPLEGPFDSIMLVGAPYDPPVRMPSPPTDKQGPLSPDRFDEFITEWHDRIDRPVGCRTCGWEGRHSDLECYRYDDGSPAESEHVRCPKCFDEDQVRGQVRDQVEENLS